MDVSFPLFGIFQKGNATLPGGNVEQEIDDARMSGYGPFQCSFKCPGRH